MVARPSPLVPAGTLTDDDGGGLRRVRMAPFALAMTQQLPRRHAPSGPQRLRHRVVDPGRVALFLILKLHLLPPCWRAGRARAGARHRPDADGQGQQQGDRPHLRRGGARAGGGAGLTLFTLGSWPSSAATRQPGRADGRHGRHHRDLARRLPAWITERLPENADELKGGERLAPCPRRRPDLAGGGLTISLLHALVAW